MLPLEFTVDGKVRNISLPATVSVNGAESYVEAALKVGALIGILADFPPTPTPVSLLYPRSRQLSPRVGVFIGVGLDICGLWDGQRTRELRPCATRAASAACRPSAFHVFDTLSPGD